ncbi:MAG: hypothetical protein A3F77_11030 [Betaproteobacteria bacterium RIFCSPLOWO2_12_FULL_67_28]|nr:MAG: hypothetical protein A3F77_11030 [Betaproteobacteria bacterium RIFCSPLOWO2_12_FULL_67_28]
MKAQVLAHLELHAVDLREKPRYCSTVVVGVRLGIAQVRHLSCVGTLRTRHGRIFAAIPRSTM